MADIYRTVTVSTCNGQRVDGHGEFEDYGVTLYRDVDPIEATNYMRRAESDPSITINNVQTVTHRYKMTIADFVKNASILD